ncbi:hypothetical protein PIB30_049420 [Stylosanthes scabra]|uniref:Uncharacterized protein n=1 Tax=Stylosanthes scabra TaxID=79078 RepID=A0ABU6RHX2_9FABA|nr:hypothetical protein [Stylosanthes scabra]
MASSNSLLKFESATINPSQRRVPAISSRRRYRSAVVASSQPSPWSPSSRSQPSQLLSLALSHSVSAIIVVFRQIFGCGDSANLTKAKALTIPLRKVCRLSITQ